MPSGPIDRAKERRRRARPRIAAQISCILFGMIVSTFVLAYHTDVPQVTRAPGSIIPVGNYVQVESREGGIVDRVFVREGDVAAEGTVLIRLANPDLTREHQTLLEQLQAVETRLASARAVLVPLQSEAPVSADYIQHLDANGMQAAAATLVVFAERQRAETLSEGQQTDTVRILQSASDISLDRILRQEERTEQIRELVSRGTSTVRDLSVEEEQLDALRANAIDVEISLANARNALALATARKRETRLTLLEETQQQISELELQAIELRTELSIALDRLEALDLSAPSEGIVQSVAFPSPGEVIAPGETLFELLPTDQTLMVEAEIPGPDIGHVEIAMPVSISVDSFDVRRYGQVTGTITALSPVPIVDERTGETTFRVSLDLDDFTVGTGAFERHLLAGMTVSVEISTGQSSLLEYFLRPIVHTLRGAFTER